MVCFLGSDKLIVLNMATQTQAQRMWLRSMRSLEVYVTMTTGNQAQRMLRRKEKERKRV
jgi:hypothetical protein